MFIWEFHLVLQWKWELKKSPQLGGWGFKMLFALLRVYFQCENNKLHEWDSKNCCFCYVADSWDSEDQQKDRELLCLC